ncbi:head-tail joining protein [Shimia ponticola]|uniref:head-tail joining protein n=1 Tax=Shimia ponticola TaxID=2582893 RepID=UPI0011BE5ECB|nr:hypothetical protein [Shimia ponticola]
MSLFNGVTELFSDVFDEPVTLLRAGADPIDTLGIYREEPVVQNDQDGHEILAVASVLKVRRGIDHGLQAGDRVTVESHPGRTFEVLSRQPSRSPADDRHICFELRDVTSAAN